MKHLVFSITLFASILYFSIGAILGINLEDNSAGGFYKVFCIIVFVLSAFFYIREYAGRSILRKHFVSLLIILVYIVSGLVNGYVSDKSWLSLVAFCLPATFIAIYYAENRNLSELVKWIDVILPIIAFSLLFSIKKLISDIISGEGYYSQGLSYFAAYFFIIDLFLLLFGAQFKRFRFFSSKFYKIVSILMLPYLLGVQLFAGGRGAMGTLVLGIIFLCYYYSKSHRVPKEKVFRVVIILVSVLLITIFYFPSEIYDAFISNFERVFSFFDSDRDMYERTSGRDEVFKVAISMIRERPLFGYGLFGYKNPPSAFSSMGYPHNIFLEILLQGGVVFFLIFSIVILQTFHKLRIILKNQSQLLILLFAIFSMTLLLYSGSYIEMSFFWFSLVYIYNYRIKKEV